MLLQRRQWTTSSVDMVRRRLSWYISRMDGGSPTERNERAESARSLRFQQSMPALRFYVSVEPPALSTTSRAIWGSTRHHYGRNRPCEPR
jgi:hypothetical protein